MKKKPQLSKWEFEQVYAHESRMSPERIEKLGMQAEPCPPTCADPHCRGWQMLTEDERRKGRVAVNAHRGEPG